MNRTRHFPRSAWMGLLPLLPAVLPAQDEVRDVAARELRLGPDAFHLPLHEDDGELWATGPDYKVRFDTLDTEFHPMVGADLPVTPTWTWRTVRIGKDAVEALPNGRPQLGSFRFERRLRHAGSAVPVVEAWDVCQDGAEQTFLLTTPPTLSGARFDIVGEVLTPRLEAAPRGPEHEPLSWRDAGGIERVRYGAAVAIDARGNRLALGTSWDGRFLSISTPTDWLRSASYPVLIDPLTSSRNLSPAGNRVHEPHITDSPTSDRRLVTYGRQMSGGDWDSYGRIYDDTWTWRGVVLAESGASLSVRNVSTGYVEDTDTFVAAFEEVAASVRSVRARVIPANSVNTAAGTEVTISPTVAGRQHGRPVVGGAERGDEALIVYEDDQGIGQDSDATRIRARILDTSNFQRGPVLTLSTTAGASFDAQAPSVTDRYFYGDWVVAWQERRTNLPTDDWDILLHKVEDDGTLGGQQVYSYPTTPGLHKFAPKITGEYNDFVLVYLSAVNTNANASQITVSGSRVRSAEFFWPTQSSSPSAPREERVLATDVENRFQLGQTTDPVAFDVDTESHYVATWLRRGSFFANQPDELHAARVGGFGVLESHVLASAVTITPTFGAASTCFDPEAHGFLVVFGETAPGTGNNVVGRVLEHPNAIAANYGPACGGSLSSSHLPLAGSRYWRLSLYGGNPDQATWFLAGVAADNFMVPGLSNCPVLLDVQTSPIVVGQDVSTQTGRASIGMPIPDAAAGVDIYWQALQTVPLQVTGFSDGLFTAIR